MIRAILQLNTGSLIHVMPAHALPEEGEHGVMIERGPRGLGIILYVNVNDLDTFYEAAKQEFILCMLLEMNLGEIGHSDSLIPLATTCFAQRIGSQPQARSDT